MKVVSAMRREPEGKGRARRLSGNGNRNRLRYVLCIGRIGCVEAVETLERKGTPDNRVIKVQGHTAVAGRIGDEPVRDFGPG